MRIAIFPDWSFSLVINGEFIRVFLVFSNKSGKIFFYQSAKGKEASSYPSDTLAETSLPLQLRISYVVVQSYYPPLWGKFLRG